MEHKVKRIFIKSLRCQFLFCYSSFSLSHQSEKKKSNLKNDH